MRTLIALAIITAMFVATPTAIAGQKKPPERLCLEWQSNSTYHHLSVQRNGRIYDKDNGIKTYVITGADQYGPVDGSGYIARGTNNLLATYGGMYNGDTLSTYQLKYNITTKSGTIYYRHDISSENEPITGSDTVYKISCQKLNLPPID